MHKFTETRPEFDGFTDYYCKELHPFLSETEIRRTQALRRFYGLAAGLVLLFSGIAVVFWTKSQSPIALFIPLAFGSVIILGLFHYLLRSVQSATKNHLVSGICHFMGWSFSEIPAFRPDMTLLAENDLIPQRYHRSKFEDQMSGLMHGATFTSLECHLEKREKDSDGDTKWRTVFRGAILTLEFPRKFLGKTVVLRDAGLFNRKTRAGMKRVGLVDPKFEKIFEAYGTDQVEARYLLTPTFMQKLIDLEDSVDGKRIRFGFIDSSLYIIVETENRFEAGSMLKPLTDIHRTQKILDEISTLFDIVDGVLESER